MRGVEPVLQRAHYKLNFVTVTFRLPVADVREVAGIQFEPPYQTVGYRGSRNQDPHPVCETDLFTRFYDESIEPAAVTLVHAEALISD